MQINSHSTHEKWHMGFFIMSKRANNWNACWNIKQKGMKGNHCSLVVIKDKVKNDQNDMWNMRHKIWKTTRNSAASKSCPPTARVLFLCFGIPIFYTYLFICTAKLMGWIHFYFDYFAYISENESFSWDVCWMCEIYELNLLFLSYQVIYNIGIIDIFMRAIWYSDRERVFIYSFIFDK